MINKILILALILSTPLTSYGVERRFQDLKLPTQQLIEKQDFGALEAAGTTDILNASDGPTSAAAATVSTFVAQPDAARNLVITPGTSTGEVESCDIVVSGTDYNGGSISETFAFSADQSSATTGAKAFKTVSSIAFPASCESSTFSTTWDVGYGEKIGLKNCIDADGDWLHSSVGGTYESTRATIVSSATSLPNNTVDLNGTMNGSNEFKGYFMQNFRCVP